MNLDLVMDEIAAVAATVPSLRGRTYAWPAEEVSPPAAMVTYPSEIDPLVAFQRGTDRWSGGLVVVVGRVWDRATRNQIAGYVSGDGPESIIAALFAHDWQQCAYCVPQRITFDAIQVAGVEYMAALFELDIAGDGTEE